MANPALAPKTTRIPDRSGFVPEIAEIPSIFLFIDQTVQFSPHIGLVDHVWKSRMMTSISLLHLLWFRTFAFQDDYRPLYQFRMLPSHHLIAVNIPPVWKSGAMIYSHQFGMVISRIFNVGDEYGLWLLPNWVTEPMLVAISYSNTEAPLKQTRAGTFAGKTTGSFKGIIKRWTGKVQPVSLLIESIESSSANSAKSSLGISQ